MTCVAIRGETEAGGGGAGRRGGEEAEDRRGRSRGPCVRDCRHH